MMNIKNNDLVKFYGNMPGAPKGTPVQLICGRVIDAGTGRFPGNPALMTEFGQMEVLREKLMPR